MPSALSAAFGSPHDADSFRRSSFSSRFRPWSRAPGQPRCGGTLRAPVSAIRPRPASAVLRPLRSPHIRKGAPETPGPEDALDDKPAETGG